MRNGSDIAKSIEEIVNRFAGHGIFLKDGRDKITALLKTIENNVFETLDGSIPVWVNQGTEEKPIWLACRGTGLCENYHRYNKSLHLYRYVYSVGNALYIWSLFIYSHRQRFHRLRYDILEYLFDLQLANELKYLQTKVEHNFDRFLRGHAIVEPVEEKDYMCGLSIPGKGSGLDRAVEDCIRNHMPDDYEMEGPNQDFKLHDKPPPIATYAKGFSNDRGIENIEWTMLTNYLLDAGNLTPKGAALVNGHTVDVLLQGIKGKKCTIDTFVEVGKLTYNWNTALIEAFRIGNMNGKEFSSKFVHLKAELLIRQGIEKLASNLLASKES